MKNSSRPVLSTLQLLLSLLLALIAGAAFTISTLIKWPVKRNSGHDIQKVKPIGIKVVLLHPIRVNTAGSG